MPVVSKGEFTVSRLDDGVSSHLHVGWLMADGTFTDTYPGDNLLDTSLTLNNSSDTIFDGWKNGTSTVEKSSGIMHVIVAPEVSQTGYSIHYKGSRLLKNTTYFFSIDAKGSGNLRITYRIQNTAGQWAQGWTEMTAIAPLTADYSRYVGSFTTPNWDMRDIEIGFYPQGGGTEAWQTKPKLEISKSATIYTPSPSEDYTNAYPKYRGEYTDTVEADSTDPNRYTWTAYLGEQGPPTGVISQSTIPSSPYVGMLWQNTGNVSGYISNATYRWNGSAWEIYQFTAQNILADTFTGFVFRGVEFIGSKFVSEFDIPIGTETGAHAVGQTVIENGGMVTDMVEYLTDGDYDKHLEFSPNKGILMAYKGRQTSDTQEAQLTPEGLRIKTPVAEAILSVATIYSLVNPARNDTAPPDDANRKGVVVNYFRVGNLVNVAIKFELLKDTGWVALAPSPPSGYYPTSMYQASGVAGSVSFRGQTCMVYCNPDGLRLIPTTGQGTGEFQLSLTWTTNDPFPYGDS